MTWDGDPHSVLAVLKHEAQLLLSSMSSRSPSMPSMAGTFQLFPCNASPTPLVSPDGVPDFGTLRFSRVVNYTLLVTGIGGLAAFPANFGISWESFPAKFSWE